MKRRVNRPGGVWSVQRGGLPEAPARARRIVIGFLALGVLGVCLARHPAEASVQQVPALGARVDWGSGDVRVAASVPASAKAGTGSPRESALNAARRNLRSLLERLGKGGGSVFAIPGVGEAARLAALIASARIVSAGPAAGGRFEVVLSLKLPRSAEIAAETETQAGLAPGALTFTDPDPSQVRSFPPPPATGEEALLTGEDVSGPFTGLVVDTRGFQIISCMSPRLLDAALRDVYSGAHASVEFVEDVGVVGYVGSIATALRLPRVGSRPLVIRAVGAGDTVRRCPVITLPDARRVLAGGAADIFRKCAVCFVVDERR